MQGIDYYAEQTELELHQFVVKHQQLVKRIALHIKRRLPSFIELDDLLQAGFIGLLEARTNFKSDMKTSFETFAGIRIRGAIIDSLRKNSWGTRETLKHAKAMGKAIQRLEQQLKREPTAEEVATELGLSLTEHLELCTQVHLANVISLDENERDYALVSEMEGNPALINQKEQMLQFIKSELQHLSEREQTILSLYYVDEFTFKQIGEILMLTEARICQIHAGAIARLKMKLDTQ